MHARAAASRNTSRVSAPWAAVAAAAIVLAACGGKDAIKPAELKEFTPTAQARVVWRGSVGSSKLYTLTPAIDGSAVYAAGYAGRLARFDAASGREAWRIDPKLKLSGAVGAGTDLVLVASEKGAVVAYGADGKERWRSAVTSQVLAAPRVAAGTVVVRSGDGRVVGLDVKTGAQKWEHQTTVPPLLLWSDSGVEIVGSTVLVALHTGKVAALNLDTGALLWEVTVGQPKGANELERMVDIAAAPIVDGEQACAVAFQGRVACFDLARGTLSWSREASSTVGLTADSETLYLTDTLGAVLALDKSSGATLWKQDVLYARAVSAPVVVGSFVVVGDFAGYVHFFERIEGTYAARLKTDGSPIRARPQRLGQNVLVQTRNGGVYSIAVQ